MPPIDPTPVPDVGSTFGRAFELSFGRVLDYSSERGLGTLVATDGADRAIYDFHCTTIADGSREIADGAEVVFRVCHQLHGAVGFCDETTLSWLSRYSQPLRRLPLGLSATRDELTRRVGGSGLTGLFA